MDQGNQSQPGDESSLYAGKWIAKIGNQVVGQGGTPDQAFLAAKSSRFKETPEIYFVPINQILSFNPVVALLPQILPEDQSLYLVGGAVRDVLLQKPSNDLDFVVPSGAMEVARKVGDALNGNFYPLDYDRDYGRVILSLNEGERLTLDFTPFQGKSIESDLLGRDFSINAMAVEIRKPEQLLDPLGGLADLRSKTIRACSAGAFDDDPIRILRALRLAAGLEFKITSDTRKLMRSASPKLAQTSAERLRDEIFRILGGPKPGAAIRAMDILGVITYTLPEILELKEIRQSPPHISDVWEHSIRTLDSLENILTALRTQPDTESYSNLHLGAMSVQLGRYRSNFRDHLAIRLTPERSIRPLLFLAGLYHDSGKPATQKTEDDGRIRFIGHETIGSELVTHRGHALQLSNLEIDRLKRIVLNHMRPLWLAQDHGLPSRRSIYRYFRSTADAGVDICLLSLADTAAIYAGLPADRWSQLLEVVRVLLQTWWEGPEEIIHPESLVNGKDLMDVLGLVPGPEIGSLLEAIREAQAAGQVASRTAALEFAASLISENNG